MCCTLEYNVGSCIDSWTYVHKEGGREGGREREREGGREGGEGGEGGGREMEERRYERRDGVMVDGITNPNTDLGTFRLWRRP